MEKTWRWFGKKDKITLSMLRQIGVEGIVTALHDVPLGEVWTREQIRDLREYIEAHGLRWSVVESLPVTETIKYGGPDRDEQIAIYKESLRNLSAEGIHTVCYNFMPVLDWARTDLLHPNADGSSNLYFSYSEFAYFDIHILKRAGAREDWAAFTFPEGVGEGRDILAEVEALAKEMTPEREHALVENIVIKTQESVIGVKGLKVNNEVPNDLMAHDDINVVRMVLQNLLGNAVKFSYPDGEISIKAETQGDRIWVTVADNGMGIGEKKLDKIFNYMSTSSQGINGETGTGIGLFVSKQFIDKIGGEMSIESTKGVGTTVRFSIHSKNK